MLAGDRHLGHPKRTRLLRAEQAAEPDDDPEATARVRAFLDRMIRPR